MISNGRENNSQLFNNNINNNNSRYASPVQRLEHEENEEQYELSKSNLRKRIVQTIIDLICIVITFGIFILVYFLVTPKNSVLFCNDTDIFNPYKDDTIAFWVVGIYATLGPILFIIFVELRNSKFFCNHGNSPTPVSRKKLFVVSTLHMLMLFILGIAITLLITEIGKRWVGRLRPHFMSVCQPIYSSMNCTTTYGTNVIYNPIDTSGSFCQNSVASAVQEARVSFPSGHSSYSTYCMLFLIIYLDLLHISLVKLSGSIITRNQFTITI